MPRAVVTALSLALLSGSSLTGAEREPAEPANQEAREKEDERRELLRSLKPRGRWEGQELPRGVPDLSAPPEAARHVLIDKAAIAKDSYKKLEGLEERGNPHLPRGFLLRSIEIDPARSQIPEEELRRRALVLVGRGSLAAEPRPREEAEVARRVQRRAKRAGADPEDGGPAQPFAPTALIVGAAAVLVFLALKRHL